MDLMNYNIFLFQKIGNTVLKDDYEPPTYASVSGKFLCVSCSYQHILHAAILKLPVLLCVLCS